MLTHSARNRLIGFLRKEDGHDSQLGLHHLLPHEGSHWLKTLKWGNLTLNKIASFYFMLLDSNFGSSPASVIQELTCFRLKEQEQQ